MFFLCLLAAQTFHALASPLFSLFSTLGQVLQEARWMQTEQADVEVHQYQDKPERIKRHRAGSYGASSNTSSSSATSTAERP